MTKCKFKDVSGHEICNQKCYNHKEYGELDHCLKHEIEWAIDRKGDLQEEVFDLSEYIEELSK